MPTVDESINKTSDEFSPNYPRLIARTMLMGPLRGGYQGASAWKLLFVVGSVLLGFTVPFANWIILSAVGFYAVVETIKYYRNELKAQKTFSTRENAFEKSKKEHKETEKEYPLLTASKLDSTPKPSFIQSVKAAFTMDNLKQIFSFDNLLSIGETVYTRSEVAIRSFKDSAKLVFTTLFLTGVSYKVGLFAVHPALCFGALAFASVFGIMAFIEEYTNNKRDNESEKLKQKKKAMTETTHAHLCKALVDEKLDDTTMLDTAATVNVWHEKLCSKKEINETEKPKFKPGKLKLLLHWFCGFINGSYLCSTLFLLSTAFFGAIGLFPIIMLASSTIAGGLSSIKFTTDEWRRQKDKFNAQTKLDLCYEERKALYQELFELNRSKAQQYDVKVEIPKKTPSLPEKIADFFASPCSRIRHLGRAFKNSTKLMLAAFLVGSTGLATMGLAALIPVSIFVILYCGLTLVEFNTKSNAKHCTKDLKEKKKAVKEQIYDLKLAIINENKDKPQVSVHTGGRENKIPLPRQQKQPKITVAPAKNEDKELPEIHAKRRDADTALASCRQETSAGENFLSNPFSASVLVA